LRRSDPALVPDAPSFEEELERLEPRTVLLDTRMRSFLETPSSLPGTPGPAIAGDLVRWLDRRGAVRIARVEDATYGDMDIYLIPER
jgi:hypothetical protein